MLGNAKQSNQTQKMMEKKCMMTIKNMVTTCPSIFHVIHEIASHYTKGKSKGKKQTDLKPKWLSRLIHKIPQEEIDLVVLVAKLLRHGNFTHSCIGCDLESFLRMLDCAWLPSAVRHLELDRSAARAEFLVFREGIHGLIDYQKKLSRLNELKERIKCNIRSWEKPYLTIDNFGDWLLTKHAKKHKNLKGTERALRIHKEQLKDRERAAVVHNLTWKTQMVRYMEQLRLRRQLAELVKSAAHARLARNLQQILLVRELGDNSEVDSLNTILISERIQQAFISFEESDGHLDDIDDPMHPIRDVYGGMTFDSFDSMEFDRKVYLEVQQFHDALYMARAHENGLQEENPSFTLVTLETAIVESRTCVEMSIAKCARLTKKLETLDEHLKNLREFEALEVEVYCAEDELGTFSDDEDSDDESDYRQVVFNRLRGNRQF